MQNCGIPHFCAKFECLSFVGLGSNGQAGIKEVQNRGISRFCAKFECLSFVGRPLLAAGWVAAWRPGLKLWTGWNSEDAEPLIQAFPLGKMQDR